MATGGGSGPGRQRRRSKNGDVVDISVNKMTCAVCLEQYRRPKVLPCFHTFCQSCLQSVAGTAPSFPCPACRSPVLLPPGGVAGLQTNFYIQDDVDAADPSAPRRLLCDVCSEDRQATHTCLQCKQRYCLPCRKIHDSIPLCHGHSVVSLQPDKEEAGKEGSSGGVTRSPHTAGVRRKEEEMCGKHGDQRLLLHCKQCSANICLQCKLTLHEGHPTCDLTDEGSRVKVKLEGRLGEVAAQVQRLEGLLAVAESRCRAVDKQQQQAERDIRNRAKTLMDWANQSRDQAVQSVQLTAMDLKSPLQSYSQHVREKRAELTARHDHLTRVLQDGNDADLVSLEAQLEAACSDKTDLVQMEKDLGKREPRLGVRHESAAVNQTQMRAFVGIVTPSQHPRDLNQGDTAAEAVGVVVSADDKPAGENVKKAPREFTCSENKISALSTMCPISKSRLWVRYLSEGGGSRMKLFDEDGQVLQIVDNPVFGYSFATVLGDVTISEDSFAIRLIEPNGVVTSVDFDMNCFHLVHGAACGYPFLCYPFRGGHIFRVKVSSKRPWKLTRSAVLTQQKHSELMDVSAEEKYFACTVGCAAYLRIYQNLGQGRFVLCCSLDESIMDGRFCRIDGREMLLVLMIDDNRVHVLDHANGGRFVRYLDTGTCNLNRPENLATDYDKHVWIGCNDGKIVVVDL